MLALSFSILFIGILWYVFSDRRKLVYGKNYASKRLTQNGQTYILEYSQFENARESLYYFQKMVYRLSDLDNLEETKYDLYDWSRISLRYKDFTINMFRYREHIQLITSTQPISIDDMETENPHWKEKN